MEITKYIKLIDPKIIKTPVQLLVASLIFIVIITCIFVNADMNKTASALIFLYVVFFFVIITKYRHTLLTDKNYVNYTDKIFKNFKPENFSNNKKSDDQSLDEIRINEYKNNS